MKTLVTGMHRSGTSAVMRVLQALGADLGPEAKLMGAAESNEFGHFELLPIVELNDALLSAVGSHWAAPIHGRSSMEALAAGALGVQALELTAALGPDTYIKDPRFCLTLPFWRSVCDDKIEQVLVPLRHPRAVADSIAARNGLSLEYGFELWECYHLSLLEGAAGLKFYPLNYEDLLADPLSHIDGLCDWLEIAATKKKRTAATKLIEPNAQHHVYSNDDLGGMPRSTIELWEILRQLPVGERLTEPEHVATVSDRFDAVARAIVMTRSETTSQVQAALDHASAARQKASHLGAEVARQADLLVVQNQTAIEAAERAGISLGRSEEARHNLEAERDQARAALKQMSEQHAADQEALKKHADDLQEAHEAQLQARAAQHASQQKAMESHRLAMERERDDARRLLSEHEASHTKENAELVARVVSAEQQQLDLQHQVHRAEGERDHFFREFENHERQNHVMRHSRAGRLLFGWWKVRNLLKDPLQRVRRSDSASLDLAGQPHEPLPAAVHFDVVDNPDVSIVIPVYGQLTFTERCLRSIAETPTSRSFEIIVVDDKSPDRSAEWLDQCTGITVLSNEQNLGYLRSTNAGAAAGSAPRLLLLNNDTSVHPGWLEALVDLMDSADDIGAVGAKLYYGDGSLQEAGSIIWNDARGWNYGRGQNPDDYRFNFVREVDYCSAACLLVKRSAWDELGGFDERFIPAYYEDTDLCFALRELGLRVLYQPAARITHYEGVSHGTDEEVGLKTHQVVNRDTFLEKWKSQLSEHFGPDDSPRLASWRGEGRRVIVFDHEIPAWDRDAGSLRMNAILDLLQEMGFRVTVVPHNRYQSEPYATRLAARGFEVFHGHENWHEMMKEMAPELAAIIVSRPQVAAEVVPQAASAAPDVPVLYDMVDFHALRMQRQHETGDAGILKHANAVMEVERAMIRATDATIAVTEVEANMVRELESDANVVVVPLINRSERSQAGFAERSGSMFIGSWRHLPNRDAIEFLCTEIMPIVWESDPDHRLHLVGSDMPSEFDFANDARIVIHGWVENLEPLYEIVRCNIAPLRFGAGQKGKVADSLIRGVPVVTTAVGAEGFGEVEDQMLVRETASDLADALLEICSDEALWTARSAGGADGIEEHFGYGAARRYLCDALAAVGVTSNR